MSGGASDQLPYRYHRHGVGVADGFEGIDAGLQIDDLLLQPFNGHGLGEYQQIVLIGAGCIGEIPCFEHDLRIGLPAGDGTFDAFAADDLRIEAGAGEDAGRAIAPQILRHATYREVVRLGDAVGGGPLDRGQGIQIIHFGLSETTTHDDPLSNDQLRLSALL